MSMSELSHFGHAGSGTLFSLASRDFSVYYPGAAPHLCARHVSHRLVLPDTSALSKKNLCPRHPVLQINHKMQLRSRHPRLDGSRWPRSSEPSDPSKAQGVSSRAQKIIGTGRLSRLVFG